MQPSELRFSHGFYGKPILIDQQAGHVLHFKVSHSDELRLCAVTRERQLGVDLERIRPGFIHDQIPEHFFSQQEVTQLRSLPISLQEKAFFRCWTRMEAYLKAKGGGLSAKLNLKYPLRREAAAILDTFDELKGKTVGRYSI